MDDSREKDSDSAEHPAAAFNTARPASQGPLSGSEENEPSGHWLTSHTLDQRRQDALAQVPELLNMIARHAAQCWKLAPEPILATLLQLVATAMVRSHRIRQAHLGYSCPFNLILVGDTPQPQDWVEILAETWVGPQQAIMRSVVEREAAERDQNLEKLHPPDLSPFNPPPKDEGEEDPPPSQPPLSGAPFSSADLIQDAKLRAPCLFVRSPLASTLTRALAKSWSTCVLSLNGGIDPIKELCSHGPRQILELCKLLEMSWADFDLPTNAALPQRGVIHLLWWTHAAAATRIFCAQPSVWRSSPPPVLLVRSGVVPEHLLPQLDADVSSAWEGLMAGVMAKAATLPATTVVWKLSVEGWDVLQRFSAALNSEEASGGVDNKHFAWGHELLIRLAMLISALEQTGEPIINASRISRACSLCWWLMHEHHECLTWLKKCGESATIEDPEDALSDIDLTSAMDDILARLAAKGAMSRRDLSRTFHKLPAKIRDGALAELKRKALVHDTPDGKVALATTPGMAPQGSSVQNPMKVSQDSDPPVL